MMMVYNRNTDMTLMQENKIMYRQLVLIDPYKDIFISYVCLEATDPIKMYVMNETVFIHL